MREQKAQDVIKIAPFPLATNSTPGLWDCSKHHFRPVQRNMPQCDVGLFRQPEWDELLFELNVCNNGFTQHGGENCNRNPAAQK